MFVVRVYDRVILGLAALGAASLVFITAAIIVDVALRNLSIAPMRWTSAVVEYVMLFVTMTAAPWLVRLNAHVAITSFVASLPQRARIVVGQFCLVISIVALAVLSWRAAALGIEVAQARTMEIRSISLPAWILYSMLSMGFGLMAVEFLRLLIRGEIYNGASGGH